MQARTLLVLLTKLCLNPRCRIHAVIVSDSLPAEPSAYGFVVGLVALQKAVLERVHRARCYGSTRGAVRPAGKSKFADIAGPVVDWLPTNSVMAILADWAEFQLIP